MLDWPMWQTIGALWVIVNLRANATYWLGRGITFGVSRTRFVKIVDGPVMARAEAFMNRWGVLAVPLCFLTIGVQTAVNVTAGITRMPLIRYIPSVMVGGVLWAVLYGTIGLAALGAALVAAAQLGWPMVIAILILVIGVVGYLKHYRRKHPERFAKVEAMAAGDPYPPKAGAAGPPTVTEAGTAGHSYPSEAKAEADPYRSEVRAVEPDHPQAGPVAESGSPRNQAATSSGPEHG